MTTWLRCFWFRVAPLCAATLVPALCSTASLQAAAAQVQLTCSGTVLEARGSAVRKRPIARLRFSLMLEAEAASAKAALALVQSRLGELRSTLQELRVQELRVTSPSVWTREASAGRPAVFTATSQVSGQLAPDQLQALISQVGALPGVRLSPVSGEADTAADATIRRQLVQAAYRDALQQGQDLASALGFSKLRPLQVQLDGGPRPAPMAMAALRTGAAPFDPKELPEPSDRLDVAVTFCASP